MRERSDVLDALDVHPSGLQRSDSTLTTTAWPANTNLKVLNPKFRSLLSSLLSSTLPSKRGALAAPLKTTSATTGPAERIALGVRNGDGGVVKARADVRDASRNALLFCLRNLRHESNLPVMGLRPEPTACNSTPQPSARNHQPPRSTISTTSTRKHCQCLRNATADYLRSLTPFLPATVFFGPLRVRALVRVRCPRTGSPRRCRSPR